MYAPDTSLWDQQCSCDWSGPCNLCKKLQAISALEALGYRVTITPVARPALDDRP